MKSSLIVLIIFLVGFQARAEDSPPSVAKPLSEGAASLVTPASEEPSTDFVLRLGNESNQNDGSFGPFTYGARGSHVFRDGFTLEAGYIRLHEPGSPSLSSFQDEAQLTLKSPQFLMLSQPSIVGFTLWENRTIDMYTNVVGIEITRPAAVSFNLGFYAGNATREELNEKYLGFQLGISTTILGSVEIALSHLNGKIDNGFYRKTALEIAASIFESQSLPLTLTFSCEDRFFQFGRLGLASSKSDEVIFVAGLEVHFGKILVHALQYTP